MKIRGPDPLILLILCAAAAIRVLYALQPHVCFGDESCYLVLAKNLYTGVGYTYYDGHPELHFPPLFPIVLGALNWIVPDWEVVSRIAYVLFGTLAVIPVYLLGRDHYSKRTGLIAAFLAAILPAFTSGVLFAETMGEPLFLFLVFTGIYMICRAEATRHWAWCIGAGVFFALGSLTRPEAEYYFAMSSLFLVIAILYAPTQPRGRSFAAVLRPVAVLAASFLAVMSPYVVYLHSHSGFWSLSTKNVTTYTSTRGLVHHDGAAFQRDTWGLNDKGEVRYFAHDFTQSLPQLLLGPYRKQVLPDIRANISNLEGVLMRPWVFGPVLGLLAAIGLVGATWTSSRLLTEVLHFLILAPVAGVLLFFVKERFLYVMLLPMLLWAALGVQHMLQWIAGTYLPGFLGWPGSRTALSTLMICGLTALLARSGQKYFQYNTAETGEVWDAVSWIQKNTPATAVLMSTGPEVAFHAGRKWLPVPVATHEQLVSYGLGRRATHLCIRGRYFANRPEQKADLFDDAKSTKDLELLVKRDGGADGSSFVIYRLRSPDEVRD